MDEDILTSCRFVCVLLYIMWFLYVLCVQHFYADCAPCLCLGVRGRGSENEGDKVGHLGTTPV